jgi:hypothetical protein
MSRCSLLGTGASSFGTSTGYPMLIGLGCQEAMAVPASCARSMSELPGGSNLRPALAECRMCSKWAPPVARLAVPSTRFRGRPATPDAVVVRRPLAVAGGKPGH